MEGAPYHELSIHRKMLKDQVRCELYRNAILEAVKSGSVVLDVGAGTGLLSLFAVQAGAKKVYAVECTNIAEVARQVVEANSVGDRVEIIQDDIETVELPEKVDVIVSEWLGAYGVDENMLAPVLLARDRWLKPDGKMLPQRVTAWMAPIWDSELDSDMKFWRSHPYEISLSPIAENTASELHYNRHHISKDDLLAEPQPMWTTDMYTYSTEEARLPFQSSLSFSAMRKGKINGLAAWFHAEFGAGLILTNAPDAPKEHWGRVVFPLEYAIKVDQEMEIAVEFTCEPAGPGYCRGGWSVRVGNESWEHHGDHRTTRE